MIRWRLLPALASLLLAMLAPVASAQDEEARERAREHFARGVERYEAEDYVGALEAFQEAYRLAPHPMVRVNMANCYEQLNRPLEALHHFERFLAEADGASRQQRREVQRAMQRLQRRVGEVRLSIAPDGALVTIDSAETRRAPILTPIRLSAGTHHIQVQMDGFRTVNREIQVVGGESQQVAIALERESSESEAVAQAPVEADAAATEPEEIALDDSSAISEEGGGFTVALTPGVIAAGSTTIALTVAALVTGPLAIVANDDFEAAVLRSNAPGISRMAQAQAREDGLAAADRANTLSILTDVFTIGAIAAAGVTAFFVIVDGMDAGAESASGDVELALTPSLGTDGGGLVFSGRF